MEDNNELIALTADIVAAHVSNNEVGAGDLPELIRAVHGALAGVGVALPEAAPEPAVPIRQSIRRDHLVCLEDGAKLKMLKRYLRTRYDMSPDDYRAKWGLPRDYPMVAPAYAEQRRGLAHRIGLGRKAIGESATHAVEAVADAARSVVETIAPATRKPRGAKAAKAAAQAHLAGTVEPAEG